MVCESHSRFEARGMRRINAMHPECMHIEHVYGNHSMFSDTQFNHMVLDTNTASILLNSILLGGSNKNELLAMYPLWCDMLRQHNINHETTRAMRMCKRAVDNPKGLTLKITATVLSYSIPTSFKATCPE